MSALVIIILAGACGGGPETGATGRQPDGVYIIAGTEFSFIPDTLTLPVNQEAVIMFRNRGTVDHDLVVEEFGIATGTIRIGGERTVRFTPRQTGDFDLICSIPGHGEAGMVGTIRVVEATENPSGRG